MLTKKQINEIREHLNKAYNPLFLFDNDVDGLCSFLLLQRYLGKGKGVAVKTFPELDKNYFHKVHELNIDYIFILDKPLVSDEFFQEVKKHNIPCVWIDHHKIDQEIPEFIYYYNPLLNKDKQEEPVTYLCYQISERKQDLWIAVIGCISDKYIPEFYNDFKKEYPELVVEHIDAFDIFYKSQIGKIARILEFALKDRTSNVVRMMKFLIKAKNPYDVLEETKENKTMHYRFKQINLKYQKFLRKACEKNKNLNKILFFKYSGDLSISSDLANELSYLFPEKIIVVAYVKSLKINISIRGKNIREKALEAIKNLENASGGGHKDAVGIRIKSKDLENFKKEFERLVKK